MRKTIILALTLVMAWAQFAHADVVSDMKTLMKDVSGWQGQAPEGMSLDTGSGTMLTSTRTYLKGSMVINATFVAGQGTQGFTEGAKDMNLDTADMRIRTLNKDGFKILSSYDKNGQSGGIMVWLFPETPDKGVFMIAFQGMDDDQALNFCEQFDWKAFKNLAK